MSYNAALLPASMLPAAPFMNALFSAVYASI